MYIVRKQVYYDTISQCYKTILVLNTKPAGPLQQYIKVIRPAPLSPFQSESNFNSCCPPKQCIIAIKDAQGCELFCADRIADFFSFVISLGYKIDTALTKLSRQSGDRNIVCIISQ